MKKPEQKKASKPVKKISKPDKAKEAKTKGATKKPIRKEDPAFKQAYRDWYMGKLSL